MSRPHEPSSYGPVPPSVTTTHLKKPPLESRQTTPVTPRIIRHCLSIPIGAELGNLIYVLFTPTAHESET